MVRLEPVSGFCYTSEAYGSKWSGRRLSGSCRRPIVQKVPERPWGKFGCFPCRCLCYSCDLVSKTSAFICNSNLSESVVHDSVYRRQLKQCGRTRMERQIVHGAQFGHRGTVLRFPYVCQRLIDVIPSDCQSFMS